MDRHYVSEFTAFMNQYLVEHPEVVVDQRQGWGIYWNRNVDLVEMEKAKEDAVPDDSYGFYPAHAAHTPHSPNSH